MMRLADNLLGQKRLPAILVVAGAYYLTAFLGLKLALPQTNATAVWAPSGIALTALLLGGAGLWPGVAMGAFLANVHVLLLSRAGTPGQVLLASAAIATGNTLEALLGRFLFVRHIGRPDALQYSRDPPVLAVIAGVSGTLAAAIGVTAAALTGLTPGRLIGPALLTWWLGDLTGVLIITPLVLAIRSMPAPPHPRQLLMGGGFLVMAALAAFLLFAGGIPHYAAVAYLVVPLVLVPAIWGGPPLTESSVAVIAAVALYGTLQKERPFPAVSIQSNLLLVQGFACVLALAGSTLAAAIAERKKREEALGRMYRDLQVLRRCNVAVVHATDEQQLLRQVCRVAVETAGYQLACVGYAEHDAAKTVTPVAYAGPAERYLSRVRTSWGDDEYGRGAVGSAIRSGRPAVVRDLLHAAECAAWRDLVRESGFRAAAAMPLQAHDTLYGAIVFYAKEPDAFGSSEVELLAELGSNLAHGILALREQKQREQAQAEADRRNRELAALARMFRATTAEADLRPLLAESLRGAMELTGLDGGTLCLVTGAGTLKLSASINASTEMISDLSSEEIKVGDCLCGEAAATGQPVIIPDNASGTVLATREAVRREGIRFHAAFPMKSRQRVLGVLCVFSRTDYKPDQRRLDLVQDVCGPLALAIDNALLYEQAQRNASELEQRVRQRTAQFEEAKEAAESADRLKSAFLATMSHELRTPLNSIIGFTGILLQQLPGPLNAEQRNQMNMVRSAARHLLALINDVLVISKIEAGQLAIQPAPFDLAHAICKVVEAVTPLAQDKQLRLVCDIAPDVREFNGDQRRVEQILLNLLSNAIKFTEQGQVALRCTREPGWVVISVQDTGCGIAEENRSTLFRPFQQLDTGLARRHEGTGLGLAICKRLVDIMNGRIELTSQVGKGSTFTVRLPRH